MNFGPNDNSEDEFLCIWFVVSFIYVLHGNKNIFIVIVIVNACFSSQYMYDYLSFNLNYIRSRGIDSKGDKIRQTLFCVGFTYEQNISCAETQAIFRKDISCLPLPWLVSQMRAPLAACREPARKLVTTVQAVFLFIEHKTQYILIHAHYTRIVVFWHIGNVPPMVS